MQGQYRNAALTVSVGLLYYLGAFVGVHFAALESGIVILWPPNAVLLAALLNSDRRDWAPLVLVVIMAEIAADVPVFTVAQALVFGAINVSECLIAATLIRRALGREMDWHEPRDLSLFLVTVFFVASPLAAFAGASVYALQGASDTPFMTFWRLWWVGDATGLITLTPLLHMVFHTGVRRLLVAGTARQRLELLAAWGVSILACYAVFLHDLYAANYLALSPLIVILAPVYVAVRFGSLAGSALTTAIILVAAFATVAGVGPFVREQERQSALLAQEFAVLFTAMILYLAAFVHQNRRTSTRLRRVLAEVNQLNLELEQRVRERTEALREANTLLQELASTDELTGIPNRRSMKIRGEEEAIRSARSQRPFAVLLLDLDHFKRINDRYGHAVGDACLKAFVEAVVPSLRTVDHFGRWGGEEFIILVPDSDQVDLAALCEKVLDCVRQVRVPVAGQALSFTVSMGVAEWHHISFDRLVSEADNALYQAKGQGRDRVVFSDSARARSQNLG